MRKTYGKGRVRVMRIHRDGDHHEVRELTVKAMLQGDFGRAFTSKDNSASVSTDTVKNVVNVVARENRRRSRLELFCQAVSDRLLDRYSQLDAATVSATKRNGPASPLRARPIRTASRSTATASRSPRSP